MRTFLHCSLLPSATSVPRRWLARQATRTACDGIVTPPPSSGSATPGGTVAVARVTLPDELVGQTCAVDVVAAKHQSVHQTAPDTAVPAQPSSTG